MKEKCVLIGVSSLVWSKAQKPKLGKTVRRLDFEDELMTAEEVFERSLLRGEPIRVKDVFSCEEFFSLWMDEDEDGLRYRDISDAYGSLPVEPFLRSDVRRFRHIAP